jgi:di/tricarboxylate transporter
MTPQIVATLGILIVAIILFITERIRMDLVALLVLASLAVTSLISPAEALSGFSNSAVVTVWAVFILGGGLSRTGVAGVIGRHVLRLAGHGEVRLLVVIMLTAGVMSAFMNNVGVAALLLPVVSNIARQTRRQPSKLLMPLAFGSLLGGMTTLIGTPPNILVSDSLTDFGMEPFQLFDFAPVGLVVMAAGIAFMVLVGRHLLPARHPVKALAGHNHEPVDATELYGLEERLALVEIPRGSPLAGKTVEESRIGRALGLTILGLQREGRKRMNVGSETMLLDADCLLALGRLDRLEALSEQPYLSIERDGNGIRRQLAQDQGLGEFTVGEGSPFVGRTISQLDIRHEYGLNVLAIARNGERHHAYLQDLILIDGDRLLLQGPLRRLAELRRELKFSSMYEWPLFDGHILADYQLADCLLVVRVPENSPLVGRSLGDSHLGRFFDVIALGLMRADRSREIPERETLLQADDILLVVGDPEELSIVRGLQELKISRQVDIETVELETESAGLVEAVLAPRTSLVNRTLREINFREKYGLSVLAIWRGGRAYRSDLGNRALRFGDAFLLHGSRARIRMLGQERDFVVLQEGAQEEPRLSRAPVAAVIMVGMVLTVLLGWLPISIAAVAGSALMVLTGCLTMEEAYQFIDWRSVFLIAGMLPLGVAMEQSGAARLIAEGMIGLVSGLGSIALLAGLFVLTSVGSQFMPNAVVTVLMAPIAVNAALDLELSAQALLMVVAIVIVSAIT